MDELNKNKLGLSLGILFGLMHLLWVILVAVGLGQKIIDWAQSIHFLAPVYTVASFSILTAIIGVATAFVCGYVIAWVFAFINNKLI